MRVRFAWAIMLTVFVATGCGDAQPATEESDRVPTLPSEPSNELAPASPPVTPIAPATPVDRELEAELNAEYFDRFLGCMRDLGFEVTPTDDGGFTLSGDPDALASAEAECKSRIGPDPGYAPVTAEEAAALYDRELAVMGCLEEQGVQVPEPPSREAFIQSYLALQEGTDTTSPWSAYRSVRDPAVFEEACPPADLTDT